MQLIEWTPKLETGIAAIDAQHRKLVDLMNELHDAMRSGKGRAALGGVLVKVKDYTVYHFGTEERAFSDYSYPKAAEHRKQHADLVAKLDDLAAKYAAGQVTISIETLDFLKAWLGDHILKEDMEYVPCLKGKTIAT